MRMTLAQRQSQLLLALAEHLTEHPHLEPVHLRPARFGPEWRACLQITGGGASGLSGWLSSLCVSRVRADRHESGRVFLRAFAEVLGVPVELVAAAEYLDDHPALVAGQGVQLAAGHSVQLESVTTWHHTCAVCAVTSAPTGETTTKGDE